MKYTAHSLILSTSLLLAACGAPEDALEAADALGTQVQELHDSCTNSGVTLTQPHGHSVAFSYPVCSVATSAGDSLNTSYGVGQSSCANTFVTEIHSVANRRFQPFVEALPSTTMTATTCPNTIIVGSAWGYNGTAWVEVGNITATGVWHPAVPGGDPFPLPAYCQLRFNIGSGASGYSRVRVTGFASDASLVKMRVRTGVVGGPGPC